MSRFYRLKIYAAPFLAAATLMAPARGNDEIRRSPYMDEAARERIYRERMFRVRAQQREAVVEFPTRLPGDLERRNQLYEDSKRIIDNYCATNFIRGIAVCVSIGGHQKMIYSTGQQDENLEVQATPDLVGNISFLSKTFLMFILLKLCKEETWVGIDNLLMQDYIVLMMGASMPIATPVLPGDRRYRRATRQSPEYPLFANELEPDRELEYDTVKEKDETFFRIFFGNEIRYVVSDEQENMTFGQVMHERSGAFQLLRWAPRNTKELVPLDDNIQRIVAAPLLFEPGSERSGDFDLSNFELLASLIETISSRNYEDVMKDELIKLGLTNTTFHTPNQLYLNKTRGSQIECINATNRYDDHPHKRATMVNYASHVGSEGLCSTVKDLDKFFNILHNTFMVINPLDPLEMPRNFDNIDSMMAKYPGAATWSYLINFGPGGKVRKTFGKALVEEGVLDASGTLVVGEVYNQAIVYQEGEAREGSSIAMLFTQLDPAAIPKVFPKARTTELRQFTTKKLLKNEYDVRATSHMLTEEGKPKTEDEPVQYATVSIISTSRDTNLYHLGRHLAKQAFSQYGIANNLHV